VERAIAESAEEVDVQLHDRLFLPDVLDSDGLASIIVMVEEEWGIEIQDDQIELEIFEDLIALTRFVATTLDAD